MNEKRLRQAPPTPPESEGYSPIAQGKASNQLTKQLTRNINNPIQLTLDGDGEIHAKDFHVFIRGYKEMHGVKQTAIMLHDALLIEATRSGLNNTLIRLPLREYMNKRGLKDEKAARTQIKRDLNALERVRFECKGAGRYKGDWLNVTLAGGRSGIIRGVIEFRFSEDYFNSFRISEDRKYLYMYLPEKLFQINTQNNPYSYPLGRRILEHRRMNIGKPNENTISVRTLVDDCPNFPTYEDIINTNGHITERMIDPFERDMTALEGIFTWEYAGDQPANYDTFINSNVNIHWRNYPDTSKLESGKKKRAQRTTKRKK
jgi:hypothetical protein